MASTLNSVSLNVANTRGLKGLIPLTEPIQTRNPKWNAGVYSEETWTWGSVKTFNLLLWEKGVAWADSAALSWQAKVEDGETVEFVLEIGDLHEVSTVNVKIKSIIITYSNVDSGSDYREFEVTLQVEP